ncbi:hypothetical protein V1638_04120 [Pseudarthrobacter sp. J64]|uniref:hypothetical protein n=1 Tax=Pseudarthrobacter sp. J64 TaxID=3116485 RepID=UPI002E7FF5AD|nr:hypothetical protein [Pseudarthrobacter sp. J64]MEE2568583.1 hypothetical protein [Pseudarthrobacter sp. J64]
MRPSARVGRNRRRVCLYIPLLIFGTLGMAAAFPTFNAVYLAGTLSLISGAAGFVLETGNRP